MPSAKSKKSKRPSRKGAKASDPSERPAQLQAWLETPPEDELWNPIVAKELTERRSHAQGKGHGAKA